MIIAVITIGIVVGSVAVKETVGHNLVNALRLPEAVRGGLGEQARRCGAKGRDETDGTEPNEF